MQKFIFYTVAILTIFISAVANAEWEKNFEDEDIIYFVDIKKSLALDKTGTKLWAKYEYKRQEGHGIRSSTHLYEFDCTNQQYRILDTTTYAGAQETGDILYSNDKLSDWDYVTSDQVDRILLEISCKLPKDETYEAPKLRKTISDLRNEIKPSEELSDEELLVYRSERIGRLLDEVADEYSYGSPSFAFKPRKAQEIIDEARQWSDVGWHNTITIKADMKGSRILNRNNLETKRFWMMIYNDSPDDGYAFIRMAEINCSLKKTRQLRFIKISRKDKYWEINSDDKKFGAWQTTKNDYGLVCIR